MPVWNRKNSEGGYCILASRIGGKPGEEIVLTDPSYNAWVHSAVRDSRLFVSATPPKLGYGHYLMTANPGSEPSFGHFLFELAKTGSLDRVSISPDETKICFDYQPGNKNEMLGRTLYVADFDVKARTVTNARPFANAEGKKVWCDYPRWTKGGTAIVYHADGKLFLYTVADDSTKQVSTDDKADYRYPHGKATPN